MSRFTLCALVLLSIGSVAWAKAGDSGASRPDGARTEGFLKDHASDFDDGAVPNSAMHYDPTTGALTTTEQLESEGSDFSVAALAGNRPKLRKPALVCKFKAVMTDEEISLCKQKAVAAH